MASRRRVISSSERNRLQVARVAGRITLRAGLRPSKSWSIASSIAALMYTVPDYSVRGTSGMSARKLRSAAGRDLAFDVLPAFRCAMRRS